MACDEWPIDRSCLPALPDEGDPSYEARLAQQNHSENLAVEVLFHLSGQRFGACEVVVRPEPAAIHGVCDAAPMIEAYYRNDWRGVHTAAPTQKSVQLPGPVAEVVAVIIGNQVLDESEYVLEGDLLYRRSQRWPRNDMSLPLGEPGTWSVTYKRGEPVPPHVAGLTGLLAREFIAACSDMKCRLPRNITGVARNGVSYQIYNPAQLYATGKTGLSEVDLWLSAVNPYHLMRAPSVR